MRWLCHQFDKAAVMFISQFIISSVLASGWTWHLTVGASDTSPKGTSPWCVDDCQSLINSAKSFINCCWRVSGERSYISWQNKTQCQVYNHFAVKIQSVQWMNWKQCFYDASYPKKKNYFNVRVADMLQLPKNVVREGSSLYWVAFLKSLNNKYRL